jgi:hypothetical protein
MLGHAVSDKTRREAASTGGAEMRYEMRTTWRLEPAQPTDVDGMGHADRLLQWLYETLPTKATLGGYLATPRWLGNRATEPKVEFQLVTQYRDVFGATADRLRIESALQPLLREMNEAELDALSVCFEVMRVYGDAELVDSPDPTKKISHPC